MRKLNKLRARNQKANWVNAYSESTGILNFHCGLNW